MAVNLVSKLPATSKLYAYDISKEILGKLQETVGAAKVQICSSSHEVAESSDVVFTMVPEGSHVRAVYLDSESGVLLANLENKILIDCSTIDVATSNAVRQKIASRYPSASFYDAPVSGGSLGAANASLTLMLGASDDDPNIKLLQELLGTMGKSIFACGGPSSGLVAKLCNNYCSGLIAIATAEAMNIGIRSGIDPRVLARVFSASTAQSTISDKWNPVPGISVDAAKQSGAKLCLGEAGLMTYAGASADERCKDRDSRVVFRYLGGDEDWASKFS
ncbi:unnamed protein product [Aureobasidium pullulans]|nr:unnamed protein product [Aureobasidium pullulans]